MEDTPQTSSRAKKMISLLLKIIITAICLWYVSGKIDFTKAGDALQNANGLYLFLAVGAFVLSKVLSAYRLNMYFRDIGIHLPPWTNIKLYWLGMFYNLFLPGSISGDAYKVIRLTKVYKVPYKKTTAAVLLDRFSGLLGLGLILAAYSVMVVHESLWIGLIIAGALLAVAGLYGIIRLYFRDFIGSFFSTLFIGTLVQAAQVICVYLIMAALHIPAHVTEYIFIFLVSSVVSVLPLTVGGLGIREVVFLEGSAYFGLAQEHSVVISILFYLITLVVSAVGMIYVFKDPLEQKKRTQE